VAGGIAGIAAGGVASGEGSAHCGPGVFCDLAVLAAVFDGPTHAFSRDSAEKRDYAGGNPTGEWSGPAARRAVAGDPAPAPAAVAAGQLRGLRKPGSLPMECAVAIGKTPVRRWDRRRRADQGQDGEGETGVRGAQGGAGRRAPRGHNGRRCARPAGPRPRGVAFHHGIPRGGRVRRRRDIPDAARGRESCTAGRVAFLNALGKGWPVSCPNTPRVAG